MLCDSSRPISPSAENNNGNQSLLNNDSLKTSNDKMPENITAIFVDNKSINSNSSNRSNNNLSNEVLTTYEKINTLQDTIKQLNEEIFKDPRNKQRPPSEYLELYNTLTEKLHATQQNLEKLELNLNLLQKQDEIFNRNCKTINNNKNESKENNISIQQQQQQQRSSSAANSPNIMKRNTTKPHINIENSDACNNNFIRVFTGNSTAVIKKQKGATLREASITKLKQRNLDIDKCIAYLKENNLIIDWNTDISNIAYDNIVVTENNGDILHNFEKNTITFRICNSCNRRNLLHVYTCTRCEYTKCSKSECRDKSELFVCVQRKNQNTKYDHDTLRNGESTLRDIGKPHSEQILSIPQLTLTQLSVIQSRDRSRSENELDSLVDSHESNVSRSSPTPMLNIQSPYSKDKVPYDYSTMPRQKVQNRTSINEARNKIIRRDSLNTWEIPHSQIRDFGRKVGSGSFGTVHEAVDFYHGKVAIKFLNVQNPSPSQKEAFRNEVAILKTTRHDNILLFIGCISTPYLAIVTEWCKGSSLYKHLHVEEETWHMYQLIDIAKQTAIGMEYLHARDILHRDMKSNNIFLIPDEKCVHMINNNKHNDRNDNKIEKWTVKIGDFGLATVKSTWTKSSSKTNNPTGSILWMAPEVITQKVSDPYTQKSDIYSYGVVLYELVTGSLPYAQKEQDMILYLVGFGRLRPNPEDARKDTPIAVKNLISKCCDYDRNKRPLFVEINSILNGLEVTRLQRSQSAPTLNTNFDQIISIGLSIADDDMYPATPLFDYNLATTHFTTDL